jgi:hypothetical protein
MSISPSQLGAVVTRRTCIPRAYAKISRYDLHDYFVIIALSNDAFSSILLVGIDFFFWLFEPSLCFRSLADRGRVSADHAFCFNVFALLVVLKLCLEC